VDVHILQRIDASRCLLNLPSNGLWYKLLYQLLQVTICCFPCHDLKHLLPDLPNLTRLGIRRLAHLRLPALRKSDGEEAEEVTIGRLDVNVRLDESLPFAHKRTELVRGERHAMEVGKTVLSLDLVDAKSNLAEGLLLILIKVTERDLNYTTLE
jgi:hypothetical protein